MSVALGGARYNQGSHAWLYRCLVLYRNQAFTLKGTRKRKARQLPGFYLGHFARDLCAL